MALLPEGLGISAWIISTAIYFGLGILVGWAVKKAVVSVLMIIIAVVIAIFLLGLSISIDILGLAGQLGSRLVDLYSGYAPALSAYPIAFVIGGILGFWRGK